VTGHMYNTKHLTNLCPQCSSCCGSFTAVKACVCQ